MNRYLFSETKISIDMISMDVIDLQYAILSDGSEDPEDKLRKRLFCAFHDFYFSYIVWHPVLVLATPETSIFGSEVCPNVWHIPPFNYPKLETLPQAKMFLGNLTFMSEMSLLEHQRGLDPELFKAIHMEKGLTVLGIHINEVKS